MSRPRVLLALTVYNGGDVVEAALESVARLETTVADVDVLVLDDCSPEPGFSEQIEQHCERLGHQYYRSPRNLGIPRNVNLGLLAAMDGDYDYVIISNSDVIYSRCAVDQLVLTAQTDPRIGSVTSWSTNVSIYSIPNVAPNDHLSDQDTTDEVGEALRNHFGAAAIDIPAGISFAMLIPVPVLRVVGIMDPVFGRGYCEETDWSRRSLAAVEQGANAETFADVDHYRASSLNDRTKAALGLADAIIWTPASIRPGDLEAVRAHLSPAEAVEVVLDVARNATNKIAVSLAADEAENPTKIAFFEIDDDGNLTFP